MKTSMQDRMQRVREARKPRTKSGCSRADIDRAADAALERRGIKTHGPWNAQADMEVAHAEWLRRQGTQGERP